jgi:lipopolysaccharide export system protein LptA
VRNKEAARYARWAAMVAGLIALTVAGVYVHRAIRASYARHSAPPVVPSTVQQQSAEFKFSKMEGDNTLFTIRASQATQFKDQDRSLLENVWITIYGRDGKRNDNIHTRECSYEPKSGDIRCEGEVQIDLQAANPAPGKPAEKSLEVNTRNLAFNRKTGEAYTPEAVEFHFPEGQGRAVGVTYSSQDSTVRLEHQVELNLAPSERTGGLPVSVQGSSVEFRRSDRIMVLSGPANVKQGSRELSAQSISIELDPDWHARHAVAQGHPTLHAAVRGGGFTVSADQFEGFLSSAGWVERIVADGNLAGTRVSPAGTDHFSAAHLEIAMQSRGNLIKEMTASHGVTADLHQNGDVRSLKTDSLRITFGMGRRPDQQKIESAETLAPATIETKSADETTILSARKLVAQFGSTGRLEKLLGHSGVQIRRETPKGAPQISSASELVATFGSAGDWDTLDETGNVRLQQSDRQASAARAKIVNSTDTITLAGSPVLSDSMSRTTVGSVSIAQRSGDIKASGGVASTYLASAEGSAVNFGAGTPHISSDTLSASTSSGHVVYAGHARLWQGESVLDADQIEVWRDDKKIQAVGHVVAVFPQASGQFAITSPGKSAPRSSDHTLWEIRAPVLTYWSDQGRARLEGGVIASSQQGELVCRTLDAFLAPTGAGGGSPGPGPVPGAPGGRQLNRVLALGDVIVRQGDRRGVADQAEYTASDGKFVLSGGQPTITDASRDTTTGHSLTFFVANDTILIDSQEGSRTLTKHRVEK